VWPGEPVPVPRISEIREVGLDGWWLLPDVFNPLAGMVEVPAEVYLRQFRDTPADDLDALAELCKLGLIRPLGPHPYDDLPVGTDEQWMMAISDLTYRLWPRLRPDEPRWDGSEREREEIQHRHLSELVSPVHAAEVAYRVRAMQRTTDHLLRYLAGEPVAPAWRDCEDDWRAWDTFKQVTSAALRDFHVRVDVTVEGMPRWEGDLQVNAPYVTLYSAGMLQLVNHLAAGGTVRTCANETCRRPFVHQLGRERFGGHRKVGTLYCTANCARAQYQREKRRRDKAAKGGSAG
jgi:hypothetical protein